MTTKSGKDLQVGDKLIRDDGQAATITRLTNGMYPGSRLAEFNRADKWGRLWASIFNNTKYELAEVVPIKKVG